MLLLLLTTLLLPLTQGETCFTTNQLLEIIQQREAVVKEEMEAKLEAKFEAKIEEMEIRFESTPDCGCSRTGKCVGARCGRFRLSF